MSRFEVIRQFRRLFGTTPRQFLIDARIDRAKRLLSSTNQSITRICLEVGFLSLGSFSDLFRRRVGVTPSAYRRRVRKTRTPPPACLTLMVAAFAISEKSQPADSANCTP